MTATERQAAQSHFEDLCRLLGVQTPLEADPSRTWYAYEKNVLKLDGRSGRADVWRKGCFAWEYKGHKKNLTAACSQLKEYADALANPPLLIVSDMREIRIHTNFTNTIAETSVFQLADLNAFEVRQKLKWAFTDPERLRPELTREKVTAAAATAFGRIAQKLIGQGYDRKRVAHFLNKLVFCLFAQDVELLPDYIFSSILDEGLKQPDEFADMLRQLFRLMSNRGGRFGTTPIPWFDGGLFDDDDVLPLHLFEIKRVAEAARLDWSAIEPSIFGTLFERGLDPEKRKQMASLFDPAASAPSLPVPPAARTSERGVGIHYTDPATIMKIIEPVVLRPLRREWEEVKVKIEAEQAKAEAAEADAARTRQRTAAREVYSQFRDRLGRFRVLDPACGSGNFLYLSLWHLKDFDLRVMNEGKVLAMPPDDQRVTPQTVLGIEINEYAAELARVTIWIGELQWQLRNGFGIHRSPILGALNDIECRDALINDDGSEAEWPAADAVVGNPPFLGGKRLISGLGEEYVSKLFKLFDQRVPAEADLVCYWLYKAGSLVKRSQGARAGLVATNSVRGGANRKVLQRLSPECVIFDAWDDEPWVLDGAAVRVALVGIAKRDDPEASAIALDGAPVLEIHADLTARVGRSGVDLTRAQRLPENGDIAFMGDTKGGSFDIDGALARRWLLLPLNPNGRPNSDVLTPWVNGMDLTRRPSDTWIIDFGWTMSEVEAAFYELPFAHVSQQVRARRLNETREPCGKVWWRHLRPRPDMRQARQELSRYLATPRVAKHRLFVWLPTHVVPDFALIAVARDDDVAFGILHSRFHELWALRLGTSLEDRPRYTPSTTFETFPFPEGLTPNIPAARYADDPRAIRIADAARRLNELREAWLNPPDLVMRVPEVVPGYPDRIMPISEKAAKELKKRTLTNLYNARPAWLDNIHRELDEAVAAAYGWPTDLADDEILKRLLDLNLARAAANPSPRPSPAGRGRTAITRNPFPTGEGATPGSEPGGSG